MLKKSLIFLFVFIFISGLASGLKLSPAIIKMDFQPGYEDTFSYSFSGAPRLGVDLYVEGDLAEYVELSEDYIKGSSGSFSAKLKLPDKIEKPGRHRILVVVDEREDEELSSGIGTSIILKSVIDVYVPYPGKYLEIEEFKANNANSGEPVEFKMSVVNRGRENLVVSPRIEISSGDGLIETLNLKEREINSTDKLDLVKVFDTTNVSSGNYNATAIFDYGSISKETTSFKIGSLDISVRDYTKRFLIDDLAPFDLQIESGWNNKIDGAYAEVFIYNSSRKITEFKTTTTSLDPWETKNITGYIDTGLFHEGVYNANISINYYGGSTGKSSSEVVQIEFVNKTDKIVIIAISAVVILILLAIVFLYLKFYLHRKNGKRK